MITVLANNMRSVLARARMHERVRAYKAAISNTIAPFFTGMRPPDSPSNLPINPPTPILHSRLGVV